MTERFYTGLLRFTALVLFVFLAMKLGLLKAIIISFIAVFFVPKEVYGLIELSISATFMKWMFRFWPVTLILGILAWLARRSHECAASPIMIESEKPHE